MKKSFLIFFLLPLFIGADSVTQVNFYAGSLKSASNIASAEGKLYFVEFVANYCYLCKMMDETTWRDKKVVDYVHANYVPVKINVDDFDGIAMKQKYNVKVLPTIIVFSATGKQLGRYEESMGGTKMLETLKKYDNPLNRTKSSAPAVATPPKPSTSPVVASKPAATTEATKPTIPATNNKPAPKQPEIKTPPAQVSAGGQGLFEFSVKKRESKGFGVQIGVFGQYGNVLREAEMLERKFQKPVLVNINTLNDQIVYRVIVGAFNSKAEAASYGKTMKSKGYTGIVKDLSQYK